jgi:hypothetical protein
MKKLIVLVMALLMVMPTYGENYTPSQDAFQANDVPLDSSLPFDKEYADDDDEDPVCPGEPMPEVEEAESLIPPIPRPPGPRPRPFPRRRRRSLCIAQGENRRDLYYAVGRNHEFARRAAKRRCRRETFSRRCRIFWCGRVNN